MANGLEPDVITQPFNFDADIAVDNGAAAGSGEVHGTLVQRFLNPLPEFQLLSARDDGRAAVQQFVRERYNAAYGAEVTHFLPWLLTMQCLGNLSGAAGLQPAGTTPLFLEQYLDMPVEQALAARLGAPVERHSLVEVGNLVAARKGASHLLFLLFTAVLHAAGYQWIVFTATHALRNNLEKLGLSLVQLKQVDASTLPPAVRAEWGSYYATEPVVMACNLQEVANLVNSKALYRRIARVYRDSIRTLAARIGGCDHVA